MASHLFNEFKRANAAAEINLGSAAIHVALLMTNTTADTDNDGVVNVDDITTLDEFDGGGYTRKVLASQTITKDDTNDRAVFDAADATWTALEAGTRSVAGALVYYHYTNDAASIPIAWIEFSVTPDGTDFLLRWNSAGIFYLG